MPKIFSTKEAIDPLLSKHKPIIVVVSSAITIV